MTTRPGTIDPPVSAPLPPPTLSPAARRAPEAPRAADPAPGRRARALRLARDPLVVFLLAGVAIFAAYFAVDRLQRGDPIRYTPEIARQQVAEFEGASGRKATAADRARLRDDYIGDELLFREALARGMHLTDPEIRARMVDNLRYLVVGAPADPTEEQLIDFYAAHPDLYRSEPGISFAHVFFAQRPRDSAALLARLNAGETVAGEDFWMGRAFPDYGISMIRGMFGQPFLAGLERAPAGRWYGPVQSPRGWHFVRKTGRRAATRIPYATARAQVRQDYLAARGREALDKEIRTLKGKYDVDITG